MALDMELVLEVKRQYKYLLDRMESDKKELKEWRTALSTKVEQIHDEIYKNGMSAQIKTNKDDIEDIKSFIKSSIKLFFAPVAVGLILTIIGLIFTIISQHYGG